MKQIQNNKQYIILLFQNNYEMAFPIGNVIFFIQKECNLTIHFFFLLFLLNDK